jgi:hypothetical protein
MILQGKGGVGKSFIAAVLAQYKLSKGQKPVLSRYSAGRLRSRSTIEVQHSTESLTPLHPCFLHRQSGSGLEQSVLDALVIALRVIVHYEFGDGTTQRSLPYENHSLQAFLLDRAHEALRMGIQIRRSGR